MNKDSFPYPIKLVKIRDSDVKPNQGNGGDAKVFGKVTPELRKNLATQVNNINELFKDRFKNNTVVPAVAKVKMKNEAIAKSHRPTNLFSKKTCPIIGVGNSNELYLEVTPTGLRNLEERIVNSNAKTVKANISTLSKIEPFLPEDAIKNTNLSNYGDNNKYVKVKLFKFLDEKVNAAVEEELKKHLESNKAKIEKKINYSDNISVYKVLVDDNSLIENIADFGAIKSLSSFPVLTTYRPSQAPAQELENLPVFLPSDEKSYPYVGVVDSGVSSEHPYISPWVEHTEEYVLPEEKNHFHGSFVSGIISYGNRLNGKLSPYDGVKIIDVCVIPNIDEDYGPVGALSEDELVEVLNEVVPRYSGKVKVWNLSLGSSDMCDEESFSDLAVSLDQIQDENDVIFVISAGNYDSFPIRSWPVSPELDYEDRITSPADSVRAITVGSISHLDTKLCKKYYPSPFSRKGPGPSYITKPDLVDFGGSIENFPELVKKGISSFDEDGNLIEDIGTSFSTPRISALLSKIYHYLGHQPSVNLAKALLIHSSIDMRTNSRFVRKDKEYLGFGKPDDIDRILNCTKSSSTVIFEGTLYPSSYIEITDFPFPEVLVEGDKCYGEIYVTLVYNPPLDSNYGFEYCRSNIEVTLGTTKDNGKYSGQVPLDKIGGFEKELIANGMKWSPVKVYHRKISKGIENNPWKLRLDLQGRSGEVLEPQDFTLIVTIRDPENEKQVYADVAQQLEQRFMYENLVVNNVRNSI